MCASTLLRRYHGCTGYHDFTRLRFENREGLWRACLEAIGVSLKAAYICRDSKLSFIQHNTLTVQSVIEGYLVAVAGAETPANIVGAVAHLRSKQKSPEVLEPEVLLLENTTLLLICRIHRPYLASRTSR